MVIVGITIALMVFYVIFFFIFFVFFFGVDVLRFSYFFIDGFLFLF